jgi:hypothetical protein
MTMFVSVKTRTVVKISTIELHGFEFPCVLLDYGERCFATRCS